MPNKSKSIEREATKATCDNFSESTEPLTFPYLFSWILCSMCLIFSELYLIDWLCCVTDRCGSGLRDARWNVGRSL